LKKKLGSTSNLKLWALFNCLNKKMDARHRWVCERIAEVFHVEVEAIEQFCNKQSLVPAMSRFFQENKNRKMLFFQRVDDTFVFLSINLN
jgi:hypothetical protein